MNVWSNGGMRVADDVTFKIRVNEASHVLTASPDKTLLMVLRQDLGLTGTKFNCEQGECGACTVLLDGRPVNACLVLGVATEGHHVQTIEGISNGDGLNFVQKSFVECDAAQCGYCTPGMVLSAVALLAANSSPLRSEINQAIAGNYCRCTGYESIVAAIELAATKEALQ